MRLGTREFLFVEICFWFSCDLFIFLSPRLMILSCLFPFKNETLKICLAALVCTDRVFNQTASLQETALSLETLKCQYEKASSLKLL